MENKYLIVNVGSTSKRYAVYFKNKQILNLHFRTNKGVPKISRVLKDKKIIQDNDEIKSIGIRVVSPGIYFQKTRIIDRIFIKNLQDSLSMAPLHIAPTLAEIKDLQEQFKNAKLIGVSDSEFHSTLSQAAKIYSINRKDSDRLQIYRYGYHGISISSILSKLKTTNKKIPDKIIVCHLGGGSSITAVKNGKSIETSMGFTPSEGLPMTTRSGNIDVSAALYLAKNKKMNIRQLEYYLNEKSGLLGLSQISDDTENILAAAARGNKKAKLTIEKFVYEIKKYISAYFGILGGIDLLIFTGAIGENSSTIKNLILRQIKNLKIKKVKVIYTNEEEEIYKKLISVH